MRKNSPVSVYDRGKVEMKNKIAFLPQRELSGLLSCHGYSMNCLQWVTVFWKPKKANLCKITEEEILSITN